MVHRGHAVFDTAILVGGQLYQVGVQGPGGARLPLRPLLDGWVGGGRWRAETHGVVWQWGWQLVPQGASSRVCATAACSAAFAPCVHSPRASPPPPDTHLPHPHPVHHLDTLPAASSQQLIACPPHPPNAFAMQLPQHLQRFLTSAAKASIPLPPGLSVEQMYRTILETAAASKLTDGGSCPQLDPPAEQPVQPGTRIC